MAERKNYDSDFCGNLPLNNLNIIQDYGYLLVLKPDTLQVLQCSENLAVLLNKELKELVSLNLAQLAAAPEIEKLRNRLADPVQAKAPMTFEIGGVLMEILIHNKEGYTIIEMEKKLTSDRLFTHAFEEVKLSIAKLEACKTVEDVSRVGVAEIKSITGFDGVMMYRFDQEWNGTVIAEDKVPELEHYLGHTFPASDVPRQARQLYLKNPYRLIPDRNYQPIGLYPVVNPVIRTFTDLSDCNLRGVAAVHLEYLKNMQVSASMSIRVIFHEQLWGLIACHHRTTKLISLEICSICELLSTIISAKIESLLHSSSAELVTDLQKQQSLLIARVYSEDELEKGLIGDEDINIAKLFNADAAVVVLNGNITGTKNIPDTRFVEDLVLWLQTKNIERVFATDHLPDLFEDAIPVAAQASGILVFPIDAERGDFVICFRNEVKREIKWGGNPDQAINFELDGKNYHPRNSFKLWQQTVHQTSIPWSNQQLTVAETIRSFIYEFNTKRSKF